MMAISIPALSARAGSTTARLGGECTTSSGTRYLLSAAHCWVTGTGIKNYSYSLAGAGYYGGSKRTIGTVTNRDSAQRGLDVELIKADSSPAAFTGTINHQQVVNDSGSIGSYDGDQVCQDGAFEDETCGLVIDQVNQCISFTEIPPPATRTACEEDHAYNPSGKIANGEGDSGSGVIRFSGAAGIDSASSGGQLACVNYPKITHPRRKCYSDIWYADMPQILKDDSRLGVKGLVLRT